jgi:hypothetical protein
LGDEGRRYAVQHLSLQRCVERFEDLMMGLSATP